MISEIAALKQIYSKYGEIYEEIKQLEEHAIELSNRQRSVHQRLSDAREAEKIVINKIEADLGRPLNQEDLLQIIRNHEG